MAISDHTWLIHASGMRLAAATVCAAQRHKDMLHRAARIRWGRGFPSCRGKDRFCNYESRLTPEFLEAPLRLRLSLLPMACEKGDSTCIFDSPWQWADRANMVAGGSSVPHRGWENAE